MKTLRLNFNFAWGLIGLTCALLTGGCPLANGPSNDAGDGGDAGVLWEGGPSNVVVEARAHMAAAGCPEGIDGKCVEVVGHVLDAGLTKLDVACLARAGSAADVRACGVRCADGGR